MKKFLIILAATLMLAGCGGKNEAKTDTADTKVQQESDSKSDSSETDSKDNIADTNSDAVKTRIIKDSEDREVEVPENVTKVVCVNVGALRYSCYMQAQDLIVGVEQHEKEDPTVCRYYDYVNSDKFSKLNVIGTNGEQFPEAIIETAPEVIVMKFMGPGKADELQEKTGIPVVVVPGSDTTMDENAYKTFEILGELYNKQDRAKELIDYMDSIKKDFDERTSKVKEEDKPTVYIGGVSFKGAHGFEGTEAFYGPFDIIHAKNLANETGQKGSFDIDTEQVLQWDPDYIFLDLSNIDLVKEDYKTNPDFYNSLSAVKNGKVYSQIPFRHCAANLDTALADAYFAATILYPEQFSDIDPQKKASEIFEKLLGSADAYNDFKEEGYEFGKISISE